MKQYDGNEGLLPSRYPSQTNLLQMDWEEWAPLLFLGKERHQVGKEDKEIVKEVGFLTLG